MEIDIEKNVTSQCAADVATTGAAAHCRPPASPPLVLHLLLRWTGASVGGAVIWKKCANLVWPRLQFQG
eukprot:SAG11_NODE_249_length_11637_cov_3.320073_8_plen_69_part_00